ncbi:O-antigen ligase family protein [Candidatus Sumerlaeota bacterium]|nr:O-antigen ligase family protein [Candidatus Sumerlaeota bacterium]
MISHAAGESRPSAAFGRRSAFLAAMVPLAIGPLFVSGVIAAPPTAQKHLIALAVIAAWTWRLALVRRASIAVRGCEIWVGVYAAFLLLSVILSPERGISLRAAFLPLILIGYYFLLVETLSHLPAQRRIVSLVLVVGVVVSLLGVLQYLGIDPLRYVEERATEKAVVLSTLGNPNYVASFLGPICLLAGILAVDERRGAAATTKRVLLAATLFLMLGCIVMAGARGVWLGLTTAAGFLIVVLALRGRNIVSAMWKYLGRVWMAALALALVLTGFLLVPNPLLKSRFDLARRLTSSREIHTRLLYWAVAAEMIRDRPLLGIGYGRFSTTFWHRAAEMTQRPENAPYREYLMRTQTLPPGEAHNEYIETAAEMGLIGLAAFLGMVCWFVLSALRPVFTRDSVSGPRRARILLLVAALIVILVDSLFSFPLQLPASGLLFWTLLAMIRSSAVVL